MTEIELIERLLDDLCPFVAERRSNPAVLEVSTKSNPADFVTEVDTAVQARIVAAIGDAFPDDRVVGEESGMNGFPADPEARCWVIDPIDGTTNFMRGFFPAFGISIAFAQAGRVRAGGVGMPVTGGRFLAQRGQGAFRNGTALRVSAITELDAARVELDFSAPRDRAKTLKRFAEIITTSGQLLCHGAAVIGLCSIAAGNMDAYFHAALHPWDYAAGMLIVEEAGGKVTRLDGSTVHLFDGTEGLLGTNGHLHDESLAAICHS